MPVYVNTNVTSLKTLRNITNLQNQLNTTYQRLSSGLRINSAKDDAAGLQIANRLTAQINGLNQGNRNASDGIALAQTAESSMDEMASMLQKIRTLAVQASNGTNTAEDRAALSKEAASLANEISRIAKQTSYGGKTILNGVQGDKSLVSQGNGTAGDAQNITLQVGANAGDTISFKLENMQFSVVGVRADKDFAKNYVGNDKVLTIDKDGNITFQFSKADPSDVISIMDSMINEVDSQRASLGATANRLESSVRNQSNVSANMADARSRIRDADFAEESANLTRQNIILQAAMTMLMQANQRPQLGLQLLMR